MHGIHAPCDSIGKSEVLLTQLGRRDRKRFKTAVSRRRPKRAAPEAVIQNSVDIHHPVDHLPQAKLVTQVLCKFPYRDAAPPPPAPFSPSTAALTLGVAFGFVGNYVPWSFHPSFGTCPSYPRAAVPSQHRRPVQNDQLCNKVPFNTVTVI